MPTDGMTVTLRDGAPLEIRPLVPEDREAIREGFERLSPESRYRRFFGPMPVLSERDLNYLTRVDHHDHEALIATDPATGQGVAVARYVRIAPDVAEPAITVADDWNGRGVATVLLDALVDRAREEGITRFDTPILANNPGAIHVFERLGDTTIEYQGREVVLHIRLPVEEGGRVGWAPVLREFASGAVEPARTVLELLWPRRRGKPGEARKNVIVVGTDGSAHAREAVDAAAALARATGASVEVVAAHRFLLSDRDELQGVVQAAADDLAAQGVKASPRVKLGEPALVLTDVAAQENARLIVVGAGERGKAARRLIGSVADFVAERAPCDVLIVRPRAG